MAQRRKNSSSKPTTKKADKSDTERESTIRNKETMLAALEEHLGVVTDAINDPKVTIHRSTHYEWLRQDPEYKRRVDDIAEISLDFVESHLFKQVKAGDASLIRFYLKTRGRGRGYVEKQDVVLNAGEGTEQVIEWRITSKARANVSE